MLPTGFRIENHQGSYQCRKKRKKVTVVIELRARFDEEANLEWKTKLEEAGVRVFIGIANMKVHAKIGAIKKKINNGFKYYGFVSTGNLNEKPPDLCRSLPVDL